MARGDNRFPRVDRSLAIVSLLPIYGRGQISQHAALHFVERKGFGQEKESSPTRANISREKERVPREQKWYDTNLLLCGTVNNGGRYNSDRQQYRRGIIRVPSIDAICNRAVRSWRPDLVSVSTIIRGESAITPRRLLSPTVSPSSPIIDNLLRGFHLNKARFDPARFRFYPPV